jgi:hypothetical protein
MGLSVTKPHGLLRWSAPQGLLVLTARMELLAPLALMAKTAQMEPPVRQVQLVLTATVHTKSL